MAPRSTPPPKGSFYPPNDVATYRDLLLFEERLKSNALSLQRRKARYQLFLVQLLLVIAFLLSEVLLPPQSSLLAIPYAMVLQRLLPEIYTSDVQVTVHPYFASGLLFVSVTTLVLFFASGMYSEKIAYANKYVPHANRALRSFNMYLNVRKPPLGSKIRFNPLSFFFPRPPSPPAPAPAPSSRPESRSRSRSPSPAGTTTSLPIPSIPPATNPRGELIFSSRVDKSFRDAYERYRAAFERKREERERMREEEGRWWRWGVGRWSTASGTGGSRSGSPLVGSAPGLRVGGSGSGGRKAGSRSRTPEAGGSGGGGGIMMRQRERGGTPPVRQETPPMGIGEGDESGSGSGSSQKGGRRLRREGTGDEMALRTFALERTLSQREHPK
ncbi:hypothetical protein FPV67DRAFT_1703309 [Lyophyllum atratum]|nr:hypothetical protein FPV67DRAFT_1703309 [Lyophyllum atratum]